RGQAMEWFDSKDPGPMILSFRMQASKRKLRLLMVAFSRRIWDLLEAERAVAEIAEQFAEGDVGHVELARAYETAYQIMCSSVSSESAVPYFACTSEANITVQVAHQAAVSAAEACQRGYYVRNPQHAPFDAAE